MPSGGVEDKREKLRAMTPTERSVVPGGDPDHFQDIVVGGQGVRQVADAPTPEEEQPEAAQGATCLASQSTLLAR